MVGFMPGTTIEADLGRVGVAEGMLGSVFMAGGLVLSQVSQLTGLEPHMIQNWVKRGFVAPPQNKKYSKRQFCRIVIINMLRDSLPLERIVELISAINGRLDDESDDMIDDSELYLHFLRIIGQLDTGDLPDLHALGSALAHAVEKSPELPDTVRGRLSAVLGIMTCAWASSQLRREALVRLSKLS